MSGFRKIYPAEFEIEPPPIPWIVKGFLAQRAVTLMSGVGGLGKSSFALALAAACSSGKSEYAGFRIEKRLPMAYVDAENDEGEMHRRAHYFNVFDGFSTFDGDMMEHLGALSQLAGHGTTPAFLVLDSFRAIYPHCDEDKSKEVLPVLRELQRIARESDCGILVLHHTTKGGGVFRGSGEFQNRPEFTITMKRDRDGIGRYLDWEKCRMGVEPPRHHLAIAGRNGGMNWEHRHPQNVSNADWDL